MKNVRSVQVPTSAEQAFNFTSQSNYSGNRTEFQQNRTSVHYKVMRNSKTSSLPKLLVMALILVFNTSDAGTATWIWSSDSEHRHISYDGFSIDSEQETHPFTQPLNQHNFLELPSCQTGPSVCSRRNEYESRKFVRIP